MATDATKRGIVGLVTDVRALRGTDGTQRLNLVHGGIEARGQVVTDVDAAVETAPRVGVDGPAQRDRRRPWPRRPRGSGLVASAGVGPETPEVALEVADRELARAVGLVGELVDDGRAGADGPVEQLIGIGADHEDGVVAGRSLAEG
jgi:hypothetical protein